MTPEAVDDRSNRRRFNNKQKLAIVQQTEKPGVSVAQVCRRHGVATSMVFRRRTVFGLTARKVPRLATVTLADGAANEVPALAALHDLVQPPDGTIAIELADGRRVSAPAGNTRSRKAEPAARRSSPTNAATMQMRVLRNHRQAAARRCSERRRLAAHWTRSVVQGADAQHSVLPLSGAADLVSREIEQRLSCSASAKGRRGHCDRHSGRENLGRPKDRLFL
ncbi:transposase [Bradyrhizobium sp. USDA 4502]